MSVRELPQQWRSLAETLAPFAPPAAEAYRRTAAELEAALASSSDGVTLEEAHRFGGFSVDHLQRLVSRGKIENVGRRGAPRIRRSDVPVKPGHLPPEAEAGHFSPRRRMALAVTTSDTGGE